MKKFDYAVTFESTSEAPLTIRGSVEAGGWHTAGAKAMKASRPPKRRFSSVSVLLVQAKQEQ